MPAQTIELDIKIQDIILQAKGCPFIEDAPECRRPELINCKECFLYQLALGKNEGDY